MRRGVVEVAASGDVVHGQVVVHETANVVDVCICERQPRQDIAGHLGTALTMLASPDGLADVVQQGGKVQHRRAHHLTTDAHRQRACPAIALLIVQHDIAAEYLAEPIDGSEGVNIDGVHMVGVVVHAAHQRRKFRDHGQQQTEVMHLAHDGPALQVRLAATTHQLDEQLRGFVVGSQTLGP